MFNKRFNFLFFSLACLTCQAAVTIAPISSWIKSESLQPDESIAVSEVESGYYYMLQDEQINVEKKHYYFHYAYKIVSEAGVQNASELNFSYNPAYEKFVLHSIKIYRNGKYIIKTHNSSIKELQRETDLERHIYDETISVVVVLDDIRPDDIIEYEYSTIGVNPIFEGKFYYQYYFSYSYELLHSNFRILKPASRNINIKLHNSQIRPEKTIHDGLEEIVWAAQNVKALDVDKGIPSSFSPYYSIELSEFDNWQQVNEWALRVFKIQDSNNQRLNEIINEIKEKSQNKSEQLMEALRFVQDQIRYMGVEVGINSHKPAAPNKVIEQRFGDCKDKSALLCKILQSLEIKAYPAMVNTGSRKGINERLISPSIFNHCIVKVDFNDRSYWFDPTLSYQGGDINSFFSPNYESAFVVGNSKNALEEIPFNNFSKITVKEIYKVDDFSGGATLRVNSVYEGVDADNMRSYFANTSSKKIGESFLNFYKTDFPEITILNSVETDDDRAGNLFTIHEYYAIKKFWTFPDSLNAKRFKSEVYANVIREKLNAYNASYADRTMPLYLEYPLHIIQKIQVQLPEDWTVIPISEDHSTESFQFLYNVTHYKNIIDLEVEYKTLTNEIPAHKANEFIGLLSNINKNSTGISVSYDASTTEAASGHSMNWLMLIVFIMLLGIMSMLAVYQYRKHERTFVDENGIPKTPCSLGGWLVLPIIGLVLFPFITSWIIYDNTYFDLTTWNALTVAESPTYHPLWAPGIILELLFNTFFLVFSVLLCFMLFTYDMRFPKYMIFLYSMNVFSLLIISIIMYFIPGIDTSVINENNTNLVRAIISAVIWIPYFMYSERCKETFIL